MAVLLSVFGLCPALTERNEKAANWQSRSLLDGMPETVVMSRQTMLKRIFDEPRYMVAAVGGLVAIQGVIFTLIDVGLLSISITTIGLAVVVGGLHVEARPLLTRVAEKTPIYLRRIKEAFEQFSGTARQSLARVSENLFSSVGRIKDATNEKFTQFKEKRARRAEECELQKRLAEESAQVSAVESQEETDSSSNVIETHAATDETEESPILLSKATTPTDVPESQAEEEFTPFANLVETQSASNVQPPAPYYAPIPPPQFYPVMQPARVACPYCGELIPANAIKCRFCNEFLDGRTVPPSPSTMQYQPSDGSRVSTKTKTESQVWSSHPKMFRDNPVAFVFACILIPVYGVGLLVLFGWWLHCLSTTLIVTNRRTILRTGILAKNTREVRHEDVRYLEVRQSFFNRIFGVGTIAISSAGQSGLELEISGIDDPQAVKRMIDQYR